MDLRTNSEKKENYSPEIKQWKINQQKIEHKIQINPSEIRTKNQF